MFATPISRADDTTGGGYGDDDGVATYVIRQLEATGSGTVSTAEIRAAVTVVRIGAGRYGVRIVSRPRRSRREFPPRPTAAPAHAPATARPRMWARDWRLRALPRMP